MNCREVARELTAPIPEVDPAAFQSHLAACPRCAATAGSVRQLDRVWSATRPPELSPAAWDRTWTAVTAALEAPATIALASARPARPWLGPLVAAALVAQAAAVVIAAGVLLSRGGLVNGSSDVAQVEGRGQVVEFNVEPGSTLFLELDEAGGRVVCTPRSVSTYELVTFDSEGVPPTEMAGVADLLLFNGAEGLE